MLYILQCVSLLGPLGVCLVPGYLYCLINRYYLINRLPTCNCTTMAPPMPRHRQRMAAYVDSSDDEDMAPAPAPAPVPIPAPIEMGKPGNHDAQCNEDSPAVDDALAQPAPDVKQAIDVVIPSTNGGCLKPVLSRTNSPASLRLSPREQATAPRHGVPRHEESWTASAWIASLPAVTEAIAHALLDGAEGDQSQLEYVRMLGRRKVDSGEVRALLERGSCAMHSGLGPRTGTPLALFFSIHSSLLAH